MDLNKKTIKQLLVIAKRKGIVLPGSGSGTHGNVLKNDIIRAIDPTQAKISPVRLQVRIKGKTLSEVGYALNKRSLHPGTHRVRFFVKAFVHRTEEGDYIVKVGDIMMQQYRYGIARLSDKMTYAVSVIPTSEAIFEGAKKVKGNIHYIR